MKIQIIRGFSLLLEQPLSDWFTDALLLNYYVNESYSLFERFNYNLFIYCITVVNIIFTFTNLLAELILL
jgi:hypothetical protein